MASKAHTKRIKAVSVSRPDIGPADEAQVLEVLRSRWVGQGPKVAEFERQVATVLDIKYAIAVNSGTSALHLALCGLGVGPDDAVIVPDFTFPASANVVRHCGAEPILLDVDPNTLNLNVDDLEKFLKTGSRFESGELRDTKTGRRIKGIMAVHLFGLPMAMERTLELAQTYRLAIVEDAACAFGARDTAGFCGTGGDVGCFSFHPRKIITTGEGGMVVTNRADVAEKVTTLRNHGITRTESTLAFVSEGFNFRMSDINAALGIAQLHKLQSIIERHSEIANWYDEALADVDALRLPAKLDGRIYQAYVVLLERHDRKHVLDRLREADIESVAGTYSVSAQPAYKDMASCPNSQFAQRQSLALPLHTALDKPIIERICNTLRAIVAN